MLSKKREERLRYEKGCLTDCVAYFLNMHPMNVPYFVYPRKGWMDRLKKFFKKNGYIVYWVYVQEGTRLSKVPKKGIHLVCGDSLNYKNSTHCVVYKNGKLAFDPQYPSKWSDKRITHRLIIEKI